ncbi:MAG: asparagine synthase (glutamine-hydrolyzing) [Flavobacteriaceae bacterium]|nr:asparagine synthase (glutamine-hydrolyzing) [Flavobacteriaceae bacterium]
MCGIFGYLGKLEEHQKKGISNKLKHRGPDAQNFMVWNNNLTLFHSRLSIIDIQGGNQPFCTKNVALVFNGEIYNYKELIKRHHLILKSNSDTEVIIRLYERYGVDAFQLLDGMFAIGLIDAVSQKIQLVRDRVGKKPLYFSSTPTFMFASEMGVLLQAGASKNIDLQEVRTYIDKGFISGEKTIYNHIKEVLPGHFYTFSTNGEFESSHCFWSYEEQMNTTVQITDEKEALIKIDKALYQAVEKRVLASDLEVGAFLSGGIDSALVCSYAQQINPTLRTFTVKSEDSFDESLIAASIAKQLNTKHTTIHINYDNLKNEYESIVNAYGEPIIDESIIPSYYVSKEAKNYISVILNGDGGDEIMGGYRRHVLYRYYHILKKLKIPINLISQYSKGNKNKFSYKNYLNRLNVFLNLEEHNRYYGASTDLFFDTPGITRSSDYFWDKVMDIQCNNKLEEVLIWDFLGILPKILLKKIDIATMQHALEGRSPFLDTKVVETALSIDASLKIKGTNTKYILRKLAQQRINGDVYKYPKRGFDIPLKKLIEHDLKELAGDYLYSSNPFYSSILDPNFIKNYYLKPNNRINEIKRHKGLYALLNLEIWHKNLQ